MDLQELRRKIDEIDSQIVSLYEQRMDISKEVAEYKIETGKKVFDKVREEEKLRAVKALTHNEFNSLGVEELFEQIMSMSRKLQYRLLTEKGSAGRLPFIGVDTLDTGNARVVFQGAEGAYSQAAMVKFVNVVLARAFIHVNRSCDFLESYIKSGGDKTDIRAYERFVRERKLRGNILIACVAIPIFVGYFIFALHIFC